MNDHQLSRPRSGDQWVPRRTAAPTISVTVGDRPAHNLPFGFGIREQQPVEPEAEWEWEGNPS
ncbi:MAG: hypothetical protein QOJ89_1724 [bacterium]